MYYRCILWYDVHFYCRLIVIVRVSNISFSILEGAPRHHPSEIQGSNHVCRVCFRKYVCADIILDFIWSSLCVSGALSVSICVERHKVLLDMHQEGCLSQLYSDCHKPFKN